MVAYLILISSKGGSRKPIGTKINHYQPLTVVSKISVLNTTDVLDPPLQRLQYDQD